MEEFNTKYGTKETILGSGSYGEVYTTTIPDVVIKKGEFGAIFSEMCVLSGLKRTEHVVNMLGFAVNRETMQGMIVFPRMEGDISTIFAFKDDIPNLFKQVCLGVAELHDQNVVHRDLKPANILHKGNRYYVTDLGIASTNVCSTNDSIPGDKQVGTPSFWAPEIWLGLPCGFPVDVWSLGVILYMLLTASTMTMYTEFEDFFALFGKPTEEEWPGVTKRRNIDTHYTVDSSRHVLDAHLRQRGASEDAVALVMSMLTMNPKRRPTIFEVLQSPYLGRSPSNPLSCSDRMGNRIVYNEWRPSPEQLRTRTIVTEWLLELNRKWHKSTSTFSKCINVFDAYLWHISPEFPLNRLQLIGSAAHYIASDMNKEYEDLMRYAKLSSKAFAAKDVESCAIDMVLAVASSVTETTPYEYIENLGTNAGVILDMVLISGFHLRQDPRDVARAVVSISVHETKVLSKYQSKMVKAILDTEEHIEMLLNKRSLPYGKAFTSLKSMVLHK